MVRNGSGKSFYSAVGLRALASLLLLAFLELPIAFWCAGVGAETAPFLQLETGGHLAQVKALVFTPDNRFLVSGGDDKVIRIWSTLSGKLVRTISGELGPGKQGQVYALSVSSDGKWLAAGGWFSSDDAPEPCCGDVRLYDFESGQPVALLRGHTNAVFALAFSPDSRRLVSAGADRMAIVWDILSRVPVARLGKNDGHTDRVTSAAFVGDGNSVLTGSNDGSLRLWDVRTGELALPPLRYAARVSGLAVTPQTQIAYAGYFDGRIQAWDLATGLVRGNWSQAPRAVGSLALASDGKRLLTTCGNDCGPVPEQDVWDTSSGAQLGTYHGHDGIVEASAISADAKLAATAGGTENEIHLWDLATGAQLFNMHGQGRTLWSVGISSDGTHIAWGYSDPCPDRPYCPYSRGELQFQYELPASSSKLREPEPVARDHFVRAVSELGGLTLSARDGPPPQIHHGTILDLKNRDGIIRSIERSPADGFVHSAFSFLPNGEGFVSGGQNGVLTAYDSNDGQPYQDFVGSSGAILALASSPDGKLLVSGGSDQILRIWNLESAELIASLFVADDGNWIIWTPQGYYDCSRDADKYIGWYINRGPDKNSRFITARELKRHFYRWDIVEDALVLGSAQQAADRADRTGFRLDELLDRQPPEFTIASPRDGELISGSSAAVVLNILSDSKDVQAIDVRDNDDPVALYRARGAEIIDDSDTLPSGPAPKLEIPLAPGINDISIALSNKVGATERHLFLRRGAAGGDNGLGNLKVLAIGVNDYDDGAGVRNLKFAVADAQGLVHALEASGSRYFAHLQSSVLSSSTGESLTTVSTAARLAPTAANVRAALTDLANVQPNDTVVLFIAGHGTRGEDDQYYFLPSDARWSDGGWDPASVISWSEIEEALSTTKGHRIVLLDTCRSANSYNRRLLKDAFDASLVIFSATDSKTLAQEQPALGHGVFSYALIEGLAGKADKLPQDGTVSITELAAYVTSRVESLTHNAQVPEIEARRLGDLKIGSAGE